MPFVIQFLFTLSLLGFITNLILGYVQLGQPQFFTLHFVIGLASTFLGVLVDQMSTSYFLGTRDRLIEENKLDKIPPIILEEAKSIKKKLFAACGMSMIFLLLNAMIAGCTYIKIIPPLVHHVLAYLIIMSHAQAFQVSRRFHSFRDKLFLS
ncbi:MAG: hypothetical protein HYS07_07900 [Chlamydiae bacterium]|nr:hypothetical protein [Chlamydiota bacterium]MBI3278059.1 hypothetical protein [Chlamydiota bacterium]